MKVLITGSQGQLGQDLVRVLERNHEVVPTHRGNLDFTNYGQVQEVLKSARPDVVVHAGAYTAVDQAESDVDTAYLVNAFGTRNLAVSAEKIHAKFCYISTDYVFDGTAQTPYKEFDPTNPQTVYGRSKLAGERFAESLSSRHYVVRTSWVYGAHGKNFVKTMLELGRRGTPLKVVDDQVGSPTHTYDLAVFLNELITTELYGVYHASNGGRCSWYEFAQAIFAEARMSPQLEPCTTDKFSRPAPRPGYSVLDNMAIRVNGLSPLPEWRETLHDFIAANLPADPE